MTSHCFSQDLDLYDRLQQEKASVSELSFQTNSLYPKQLTHTNIDFLRQLPCYNEEFFLFVSDLVKKFTWNNYLKLSF